MLNPSENTDHRHRSNKNILIYIFFRIINYFKNGINT